MIKNIWIRRSLYAFLVVTLLLISLFSVLGFFGYFGWLIELFSHFRLQYAFITGFCAIAFLLLRYWKTAFVTIVILSLNLYEIWPYLSFDQRKDEMCHVTVTAINLLSGNRDVEDVKNFILMKDPDILILQEYTDWWEKSLGTNLSTFNYKYEINRNDNFGIAIFSKSDPSTIEVLQLSKASIPSLLATYQIAGKAVKVLATHPLPPSSEQNFERRNEQLKNIASLRSSLGKHYIIAGDLNVTPYSYYFKLLKKRLALQEARENNGINATWPTFAVPMAIPIDHILVSRAFETLDFENGNYIGSDHYPITACLKIHE